MRYAQLVMGPAGSGKSTYCSNLVKHGEDCKRTINVVNLDPAADDFDKDEPLYQPMADIRDLISLDDVMEDDEFQFGPNGGLVYCFEYLLENTDWLQDQLGDDDDDYILFDLPGQIELYTHMNVTSKLVETLQTWNFRVCAVYLLDSHFMVDSSKYFSGVLTALSVMVNLEIAQVNVFSKLDLLNSQSKKKIDRFLEADSDILLDDIEQGGMKWSKKYLNLSQAVCRLIDDFSLVKFYPLDISDEESFPNLLDVIDNAIQYGEDHDVKVREFEEQDEAFCEGE